MNAETLMLIGGTGSFLFTLYWVRNRALREKYAVAWLGIATLLFVAGLFPQGIMLLADSAHLSYPSAVLFVALAVAYVAGFAVSIALTKQYRWNVRLTQELALLEARVRDLERPRK